MNSFVLGGPRLYWLRISGGLEDVVSKCVACYLANVECWKENLKNPKGLIKCLDAALEASLDLTFKAGYLVPLPTLPEATERLTIR